MASGQQESNLDFYFILVWFQGVNVFFSIVEYPNTTSRRRSGVKALFLDIGSFQSIVRVSSDAHSLSVTTFYILYVYTNMWSTPNLGLVLSYFFMGELAIKVERELSSNLSYSLKFPVNYQRIAPNFAFK